MRHFFLMLIVLAFNTGCGDTAVESTAPFKCTEDLCPKGACQIQIQFSDSCVGEFEYAEVLINNALEPELASITGPAFTSQGQIPAHSMTCATDNDCIAQMKCIDNICESEVWIRTKDLQWEFNPKCESVGSSLMLPTLACQKVTPGD